MRGSKLVSKDNMETLFEQHKLHNQGQNLAEEEKAPKVPQGDNVPRNPKTRNEGDQGSTQNPPLQVPQDIWAGHLQDGPVLEQFLYAFNRWGGELAYTFST